VIDEFWYSVLWGAGLGVAYGAAAWIMTRRALARPVRSALTSVFSGMMIRLAAAAILLLAVLLLLSVDPLVLVGSFLACYVVSLIGEVWLVHRMASRGAGKPN
jgi:uncharacterized membrane protein YdfJ with MMPL/SSD domain